MKKLSTVLLLALVALTACAWTAKGTGTQPAESEPTEPPAVAAVAVQPPAPEPEPKEPEWIEYEATAYCSCEKCCGSWALNRPDGIVYTASGAVAEQGVTIAADWDVLPPGTIVYIDGLGERVVQDRGGAIKGTPLTSTSKTTTKPWSSAARQSAYILLKNGGNSHDEHNPETRRRLLLPGKPGRHRKRGKKTRPVVIIQNDAGNASSPTVIVANMTTNTSRRLYPMQFDIDLPGHSPSRVQCEQIRTVDKCRLRERIYTLTGEELRKLDICLAVSFGMTRQAAQEAAHSAPEAQDDIFHELTRNGLSVAVCPLPALNQVNITITDGKTVSMTRNVAPAGGIVAELLDMKDTLKEVTP